jgi:heme exporter protein C
MFRYANPARFMRLSGAVLPWCAGASAILLAYGLYAGLFVVPPDYQQGETVRMMYVHVPAVWTAMMGYGLMAVSSFVSLGWRHPLADVAAKTAAPLGALFTALGLITGSLWGRPMWGTYWVWDARLTSFLLLLFLYLGYIALRNAIEDETKAANAAAILALFGAFDLIVIKFSVEWWSTLHQGESILRADGPRIAPVFLWPLLAMGLGYTLLFTTLWLVRIRTEIVTRRARTLMLAQPL